MASEKRTPVTTPGPAITVGAPNDDFTLCASLYYNAIYFYTQAEDAESQEYFYAADRHKRAALLTALTFFEAQMNQAAFGHAEAHRNDLPAFELDVLQEKETRLNENGTIQRNEKFYSTEARFRFLAQFLSGKPFDCGGRIWHDFRKAQELRHQWVHPKPPFDTWSLTLDDVKQAITAVRAVLVELASMMSQDPPPWLMPFEDVLADVRANPDKWKAT